jgi:hypothetical protein
MSAHPAKNVTSHHCKTVHSRAILKIVKSMCNGIKNQMHAYEMSYKCQLYPTHTHSCHINFRKYSVIKKDSLSWQYCFLLSNGITGVTSGC